MIGALYSKAFAFGQVGKAILRRKNVEQKIFFCWRSDCCRALMMFVSCLNLAFVKNDLETVREEVFDP
jgi:hypothetical protein